MKRLIKCWLTALCLFAAMAIQAQGVLPPQAKAGKPISLNKADFQKYVYDYTKNASTWSYAGALPCVIDFYADWCGPCRRLAPILAEVAKEYAGKLVVYKVDTDKQTELASYFGIQSLPTILFVPMSGQPRGVMGLVPKADLERIIADVLGIEPVELVEI